MAERCWTVPALAEFLAVDDGKILAWIRDGRLIAINVAAAADGRPRWRITQAAVDAFLGARASTPPAPEPPRRRRKAEGVTQYF